MKNNIILCLTTLLLLAACGNEKDTFVIKGELNNLGGRPLYAVYATDLGVTIDTLRPLDGKIEMQGVSPEIVPIQLYRSNWQPFMRLYLCNGERVEIKGDAEVPSEIKMKGSSLNRNMWKFITSHNDIFMQAYTAGIRREMSSKNTEYDVAKVRLDSLLTDFVEHHPGDVMSSILIGDYLLRYDNFALCDTLWQQLHEKARLPYIEHTMLHLKKELSFHEENVKLPHMRMIDDKDSICYVNPRKSRATLLCLWQAKDVQAHVMHKVLEHYARRYNEKQLQLVAISFDGDTALWHRTVESDTTRVIDLWCDDLYTSNLMGKFNVTRMPLYMLGDSLGNILVRTPQLPDDDLDARLDSLVSIDKYEIETPIFKP